ncbi:probable multidrug resistance-associated protein lethal(2)03659 isoform X1 [Leptopilina heterotoma]|uniref:probable multidrug resistance-associated protein lethal(2)03659 isoform X1 n=1 Tax=Leptopilina heterotoma TaxID=63436 RepID=UPI001CA890F1|nr:probable multidrug resistance-associated protein lethal(2)03659 isoform X1 [Leptopilina heterotoma]
MDRNEKREVKNPRENANIFSVLSFAWLLKIFLLGNKKDLEVTDLYSPLKEHTSKKLSDKLSTFWNEEKKREKNGKLKPNLIRALVRCFWKQFIFIGCIQGFIELVVRIYQPIFLSKLLHHFETGDVFLNNDSFYYAGALICCLLTHSILHNLCLYGLHHLGLKVRIACGSLMYRKILRMSKTSFHEDTTTGQIVNILSNDINNLDTSLVYLHNFWIAPLQAAIIVYLMYCEVKMSAIYGILVLFLNIILLMSVGSFVPNITLNACIKTDERLRLMNEILAGIQVIKMYAWEKPFSFIIKQTRKNEIKAIKKSLLIDAIQCTYDTYIPRVCLFVTFVSYALSGNALSAQMVFAITAYYNIMRYTVNLLLQLGVQNIGRALATLHRIEEFLNTSDEKSKIINLLNENKDNNTTNVNSYRIELKNASAKWPSQNSMTNTLSNINFQALNESLTAIIGPVGSGKSSIFHAILGELPLSEGQLKVSGKIAYVSQDAWIFASSIRQNILFGRPMEKKRYETVINVCQLDHDIAMFPDRDQTLIGEKGMTLSGGQRARINLARAVYAEADIYLLDDPLSAVDTRVGRLIFQHCITEYLQGTTRILITHHFQYLKKFSNIFVLDNGAIKASGTFQELKNKQLDMLKTTLDNDDYLADDTSNYDTQLTQSNEDKVQDEETEEEAEHRSIGKVSGKVYFSYFKAVGSWSFVCLMISISILNQIISSGGDYFVAIWVNDEENFKKDVEFKGMDIERNEEELDRNWYIEIYSAFITLTIIMIYMELITFFEMFSRASRRLHDFMFSRIIRATMSFFHNNHSGRIMNRFSRDMGTVDRFLPASLVEVTKVGLLILAVSIICTISNPWLLIPIVVLAWIFYALKRVYLKTTRDIKRLEGITSSPVFNHLIATLQGLTTIRTFNAEESLVKEFDNHQDLHSTALYLSLSCSHAFTYYLEILSVIYIAIVIYLFLLIDFGQSTATIGLVISQCIFLSGMIHWGIIEAANLENQMTSVERIVEYTKVEEEENMNCDYDNSVSNEWPKQGIIEFKNVTLRYNPTKKPVLKDFNFIIESREKVGIVGRTGAGKSSLITALFRLAHLEGEIYIDRVATSKLRLDDLRSRLSIIPQEPFLFVGSLRMNLDPFDEFNDEDLWSALNDVELKEMIVKMDAGLGMRVSDGGSNFSVGERQLLCLARAILRKNRILILDEATANVDPRTDDLIQKTIRKRFMDCTVLIIAHRLNTIMDCDKIIVLDSGFLEEMDHPYKLLNRGTGLFYEMVQQTGPEMAKVLTEMAKTSFKKL